jgi:hypothetical protein
MGDDSGGDDSGGPAVTSTLTLQVVAAGALDALKTAPSMSIPGSFGSIAALGPRLVVVSNGGEVDAPIVFHTIDKGGQPSAPTPVVTDGTATPTYADVAFHQDHFFFAVERSNPDKRDGSISLSVFDKATTSPVELRRVLLPSDPRVPAMTQIRDGRVAVAASDSRVAVVWVTAKTLTDQDAVGGYALFACTTP